MVKVYRLKLIGVSCQIAVGRVDVGIGIRNNPFADGWDM